MLTAYLLTGERSVSSEELRELRAQAADWNGHVARRYQELSESIVGWFPYISAVALKYVHKCQRELRIRGDVLEVGVHHGNSALFLMLLCDETERLHLNDLRMHGEVLAAQENLLDVVAVHFFS